MIIDLAGASTRYLYFYLLDGAHIKTASLLNRPYCHADVSSDRLHLVRHKYESVALSYTVVMSTVSRSQTAQYVPTSYTWRYGISVVHFTDGSWKLR